MTMNKGKIAFWGTGEVSKRLANTFKDFAPEIYIDNNRSKMGQIHLGKKICHPSEIEDWGSLYVVIVTDYYIEIRDQLKGLGLIEGTDFINYHDLAGSITHEKSIKDIEETLQLLKSNKEEYLNKTFIFSDFLSYDKGTCRYVSKWNERLENNPLILFSEATWLSKEAAQNKIAIPFITLPSVFGKNRYVKENNNIVIDEKYRAFVDPIPYLKWSADNLRLRHADMCKDYEYFICYYANYFIREVLVHLKPQRVIMWNAFHAFHHILRNICLEEKVPITYMEFGNVPGTFMIEEQGQMGESYPACNPEEFMGISTTEKELFEAEEILEYLYESRINRNVQPINDELERLKDKLKPGRPVIFYAGQNDFESGLQPYNENSKRYHSPIFSSSASAARYLAELSEKRDWNFIYKPHPIMKMFVNDRISLPDSVIEIDAVDINDLIDISDLVITILSTVSYVSLFRRKPTLMLGYTQLKDKGCTYQAFTLPLIEDAIDKALRLGFQSKQKQALIKHVAQLLKYCSYDDYSERPIRYGKRIEELINENI